ncbi:ATP-binding sensor histidine kinase [Nostoc sp. FACHB-110]|uniref:trifunctional serine/threonine-protein kinase/ATP-binding protein/sensor histidine kinase n=1 Tax=Nostoc sp. FACHB-110 TaxID=2692834 RepID=UPI0016830FB9|nr:ATP-binding sensor histidine kinase [Nostoc sp. FACHB-110]MBD2440462.1 AAA family ATPase [Nostoc sp. FACHB-110]
MTTQIHPLIIPGYQTLAQLYKGSRISVYRVMRERDQLNVVIKILSVEYPSFNELLQFRHQYTITHNLNIAGIIHPLSLETYGNGYILVMEDIGGISLREYIQTHTLTLEEFLIIAIQLTDILHELHQNCLIHKDIKPANILIHPQTKQVKIIDFSIASLLPKETTEIKNPHILEGTLAYISPEQTGRMNRGIDYRSDFYSLGVTFYEVLTGELPFNSHDPMELVYCHIAKMPPELKNICEIPQVVADIVMKLMAKNAENRYQSALGLKIDLEKCLVQLQTIGKVEYFAIAQQDICDRFMIPEKLYGRELEVTTLLQAFERVAKGTSEMMLVAGFAGIGKTAVVNEVHKPITRQQGYFIKGKFDQFNRSIPFSAFVQALRDLMRQLLSETDKKLAHWRSQILEVVEDNGQLLIEVIPELEKIIGKQPPAPELSLIAAQNRFNLLFHKFITVFTTVEHPLVIFLDDLQWADLASLQLIKLLIQDKNYLLLLGAYRDNEVSSTHPLMLMLEELKITTHSIHTITLTPLGFDDSNQLIADTLHCSPQLTKSLTEFIQHQTQGNPFFLTQFLKALHEDGQLTFREQGYWEFDLAQIKTQSLHDDVVAFIAQQLQKFPNQTQDVLKLAACIGNQFDLETLAVVCEQPPAQVATALWAALESGLILTQDQMYKFYLQHEQSHITHHNIENITYRFLHDRVQQAAYSLIPESLKRHTHHIIGSLLLNHTSPTELEEKIFAIVNQLNHSTELITQSCQRTQLAELNLIAGKRAKQATAYESAYTYFQQGIQLLSGECWDRQYSLALDLYVGAAESAALKTDFATMKTLCDYMLTVITPILDRVKIYELLISYYHQQSQFHEAVSLAVQTLKHLGETFPANPNTQDFLDALAKTTTLIGQVGFANLALLPPMENAEQLAAMKILQCSCFPAYFAVPEMLGLLVCRLVDLTLKYGRSTLTPFVFGIFSVLINAVMGDIQQGKQFGDLAIALEQQQPDLKYRAVTYNIVYGLSHHFYKPVRDALKPLISGYQSLAQNGDAESCAYCFINAYFCAILSGQNLNDIQSEFEKYFQPVMRLKQEQVIYQLHIWMQVVHNLTQPVENPAVLQGEYFDIAVKLPQLYQTNNFNTINYAHTAQVILAYFFGDYESSLFHASATEPYLAASTGKFFISAHNFYYSLSLIALYSQADASLKTEYLQKLQSNQQKLKSWAEHCPENFLHRFLLVKSEMARLQHDFSTAIELYDMAIAQAQKNGYLQEEALANELAAKFYLHWGKEQIAASYMQSAYYCYARWGAKTKTDALENHYFNLLLPILEPVAQSWNPLETLANLTTANISISASKKATPAISNSLNTSLDLAAVIKASQSLSSTIHLDELLCQLTEIILQNSGGAFCALILPHTDGKWYLQAIATSGSTELCHQLLDDNFKLPSKLIQYVKNTQKMVTGENLKTDLPLIDEYLTEHQPQSILCLPILNQGNLIGIFYLENSSVSGVFTSERILILNFLCTQAAISLENARLYQQIESYSYTLEAEVEQKTQALNQKAQALEQALKELQNTQARLIHTEKMSSLGQLVAGVAHEINNPVSFIKGNVFYTKNYITDMINLLTLYQQEYPQPSPAIQAKIKEIDLDFVCQDVIQILKSMEAGSDRISQIVLSLRHFSRLDEAEVKAVDLHTGIESTLLILQHRLQATHNQPEVRVVKNYGSLPRVNCYPSHLNQVFLNIINNAIDAIRDNVQDGITPEIRILTEIIDTKHLKIVISNTHSTIPPSIQDRIFEPFFTTKPIGHGTGLGLFVSYSIIQQHGGTLTVRSHPDEETAFEIILPIS